MSYAHVLCVLLVTLLVGYAAAPAQVAVSPEALPSAAGRYVEFAIAACDRAERNIPEFVRVGEIMAERHLAGGMIGFTGDRHPLKPELKGRSGGIMHIGFDGCWKPERTEAEMANDMVIVGLDGVADEALLNSMRKLKERGCYLIGFGAREASALARHVELCDVFFDNGVPPGHPLGELRASLVVDVLNAWGLVAEHVAALTRRGRMPVMAKSFLYEDGRDWWDHYFQKGQFHEDLQVPPVAAGKLAGDYLGRMRALLVALRRDESADLDRAAELIAAELAAGKKTHVCYLGHMPILYVGAGPHAAWTQAWYMWYSGESIMDQFRQASVPGGLTLRLGYAGLHRNLSDLFVATGQRVILVSAENTRPEWQLTEPLHDHLVVQIDMGWKMGDACVPVGGYPFKVFPPSGVMQLVVYEAIGAGVLARQGGE